MPHELRRLVGVTPRTSPIRYNRGMAVTIDRKCAVCERRHTFCLPDVESFQLGDHYDYVCPDTKKEASFFVPPDDLIDQSEALPKCPGHAVTVQRRRIGF